MNQHSIKISNKPTPAQPVFSFGRGTTPQQDRKKKAIREAIGMQKELAARGVKSTIVLEVD